MSRTAAVELTDRDYALLVAFERVQCDGQASTREIAEQLNLPAGTVARRLVNMARRDLVLKVGEHLCDDTTDWGMTGTAYDAANARGNPDGQRFVPYEGDAEW